MDYFKNKIWFFGIVGLSLFLGLKFTSCSEDGPQTIDDMVPPAKVSDITFKADHGGGVLHFKVPKDEDFLFVKASYTLDNGKDIYMASSFYTDSLTIRGLGSEKPYDIKITAVDRTNNESEPVIVKVTPLDPFTDAVLATVKVKPSFSGMLLIWDNMLEQNMTVSVEYEITNDDGNKKLTSYYSSNAKKDHWLLGNLPQQSFNLKVQVRDDFGNRTSAKEFNNLEPIRDSKIDKSTWSWLRDKYMPEEVTETWEELNDETGEMEIKTQTVKKAEKGGFEGGWNARERFYEGNIVKFFDDIIDDGNLRNFNFFSTGAANMPFSYYFDLGKTIKASRFRVWQRDWDWRADAPGYYYTTENVEKFEIWISSDKINWKRARTATIVKPSDPLIARNEGVEGHHFVIYELDPKFTEPFRYLEYRAIKSFGNTNSCNGSEITIYGEEVN